MKILYNKETGKPTSQSLPSTRVEEIVIYVRENSTFSMPATDSRGRDLLIDYIINTNNNSITIWWAYYNEDNFSDVPEYFCKKTYANMSYMIYSNGEYKDKFQYQD